MNWNSLLMGLGKGAMAGADAWAQQDDAKQKQKNLLAQQLMEQQRLALQQKSAQAEQDYRDRSLKAEQDWRTQQTLEKVYDNPDIEGVNIDASTPLGQLIRARGGALTHPTAALPVDQNPLSVLRAAPGVRGDVPPPSGSAPAIPNGVTTPFSPYPEFGQADVPAPTAAGLDTAPRLVNVATPAGAPTVAKPLSTKTEMDRAALKQFIAEKDAYSQLQENLAKGMPSEQAWDAYYAIKDPKGYAANLHDERIREKERASDRLWQAHTLSAQEKRAEAAIAAQAARQDQQMARQIASGFANNAAVKEFQKVADGYKFVASLDPKSNSAPDDMALIYSYAKAMDPASAVKEGEYNTVQKYAQSWAEKFGYDAKRMVSGGRFLSDSARAEMKEAIRKAFVSRRDSYDTLYNETKTDLQAFLPDGKVADFYLRNYGKAYQGLGNTPDTGNPSGFDSTKPYTPRPAGGN